MLAQRLRQTLAALACALSLQACKGPPVIDRGAFVSIASDNPNAVCEGAALALDRVALYQASLLGESLAGFSATVFLVTDDELESRCGSADANGCVTGAGKEIWIGESGTASHYLARGLVRQLYGPQKHDFIALGMGELLSGAQSYAPRYSSDGDLPVNLGNLDSRPGLAPLAGNYLSQLLRREPEKLLQLLRDADDQSVGRVETLFRDSFGLPLREDVEGWVALLEAGCSVGVTPCSGAEIPWDALQQWDPKAATCADGRVFDLGIQRPWITVQLPEAVSCTIRADTQVQGFACGACDFRHQVWSVDATPGQWRTISGLPGGERIALEMRNKDGGKVSLSCTGQP